jgi:DNA replication and repair protein RecF
VRLERLVARGFRNLADLDCELPPEGVALLGANGQGKTNLLEALYYPVLFRSFRGAPDQVVGWFGGAGFHLEVQVGCAERSEPVAVTYSGPLRKKRITVGGVDAERVADVVGRCLAVAFLPVDVGLGVGPASERRHYLDRLLSLAAPRYLRALSRFRAALGQRNSALRQGRPELARAFDGVLQEAGSAVVGARIAWIREARDAFRAELACLGEAEPVSLSYAGSVELADPAAWADALERVEERDASRGATSVGPHRDDLLLELGGRPLREVGSTGQQRTAAVALKLLELASLRAARGTEPVLLLDDVFAELDRDRQDRLARRLSEAPDRQVFVTAPRRDELPPVLRSTLWNVQRGRVTR